MKLVYLMFHGLCHQMPSRSLAAGGFQMPLCARCAGLYVGFSLALPVFLFLANRRRGVPKRSFIVLSSVVLAGFVVEAAANFLGFWSGPAALRFAVGFAAAGVLAPYVALLFYASLGEARDVLPVAGARTALLVAAAAAALGAANARPLEALLVAESFAAAAGAVMLLGIAHTAVFVLVLGRRRAVLAGALAPFTVAAQLAAFSLLRGVLEGLAMRFA